MRIQDNKTLNKLKYITLCLTKEEAQELIDSLSELIRKPEINHAHVPDRDFEREIDICVYDPDNIDSNFSDQVKKLIEQD